MPNRELSLVSNEPLRSILITLEPDPSAEPDEVERYSHQLFAELNELDIESLHPAAATDAPPGAKGAEVFELGAWIMALSASGGVFGKVVDALRDWLGRHPPENRIAITIDGDVLELSNVSAREQHELVKAFIRRHSEE
jgi:hypothetical protein